MSNKAYRDTLIMSFMDSIDNAGKLMKQIDWGKVSTERITMLDQKVAVLMLDLIDLQKEEGTVEAEIHFAPICSKCGTVLYDKEVNIKDEDLHFYTWEAPYVPIRKKQITPDRCPSCGAIFSCIRMTTKLPYTYSHKNTLL